MKKYVIGLVLITLFLIQIGTFSGTDLTTNENVTAKTPIEQRTKAIEDGKNVLKTNIVENPSFEEYYSNEVPTGYNYFGSGYTLGNVSYTSIVHSGSYAAYIEGKGTNSGAGYIQLYQTWGTRPTITNGLLLTMWYYIDKAGGLSQNAYSLVHITLVNSSYYYIYLNYVVSYGTATFSNSTNYYYILMNSTIGGWHSLNRNITADLYKIDPSFVEPTREVSGIYITSNAPANVDEFNSMVIDDVSLIDNSATEWIQEGGFESNPGAYWYATSREPAYFSKSRDATDGEYSVNITITGRKDVNGYASLRKSFYQKDTAFTTTEDKMFQWIEFDWKYFGTYNGGGQIAYIRFGLTNYTNSFSVYYLMGADGTGSPWGSNTTDRYYLVADGFESGINWNHFKVNTKDIVDIIGGGTFDLTDVQFYMVSGIFDNSSVTVLVDNFQVIAYTTNDPSFEMTEWDTPSEHIPTWQLQTGTWDNVHRSTDAHSGTYSANISISDSSTVNLRRYNFWTRIRPEMLFDASWKINKLDIGATDSFAAIHLQFEGGYLLSYVIASGTGVTYSNSTYSGVIIDKNLNQTDTWQTLHRNITEDIIAVFGNGLWNLTSITIGMSTNLGESMIVLFDDIGLIDPISPVITSVTQNPAQPMYYESTTVTVEATDSMSRIQRIDLYYRTTGSWDKITTMAEEPPYEIVIPAQPYGVTVEYYIEAVDWCENVAVGLNSGTYYSFTSGDDVAPYVNVTTPAGGSSITGTTIVSANAVDAGSGIEYVEFKIDDMSIYNDTTSPYEFEWNSRTVSNGTHTLTAIAHDFAGMIYEDTITIDVQNDVAPPQFSDLIVNPIYPQYDEPVSLTVAATDVSGISNLTVFYRINGGTWISGEMTQSGPLYNYQIPGQPYGTVVEYFILAYDVFGTSDSLGTMDNPLSYTVTDYIPPVFGVNGPPNIAPVRGEVNFYVTASDEGSGIDRIELHIDGNLVATATDGVITWNTQDYENGNYTLQFIAYDKAGNMAEYTIEYQVQNPVGLEIIGDTMSSFMASYGFFIGAAVVIVIYVGIKVFAKRKG